MVNTNTASRLHNRNARLLLVAPLLLFLLLFLFGYVTGLLIWSPVALWGSDVASFFSLSVLIWALVALQGRLCLLPGRSCSSIKSLSTQEGLLLRIHREFALRLPELVCL